MGPGWGPRALRDAVAGSQPRAERAANSRGGGAPRQLSKADKKRKPSVSIEHAGFDNVHQLPERSHAHAVCVRVQPSLIEQHRTDAGGARADDVDVIDVANVDRRLAFGAASHERDLEKPRIRLLDTKFV